MLLVEMGRVLSMVKYQPTSPNFWEDDDALEEKWEDSLLGAGNSISLVFRKMDCEKREN